MGIASNLLVEFSKVAFVHVRGFSLSREISFAAKDSFHSNCFDSFLATDLSAGRFFVSPARTMSGRDVSLRAPSYVRKRWIHRCSKRYTDRLIRVPCPETSQRNQKYISNRYILIVVEIE